jgi:hypothetical protein
MHRRLGKRWLLFHQGGSLRQKTKEESRRGGRVAIFSIEADFMVDKTPQNAKV